MVATATVELDPSADPSALVFGSRMADDRWFCWEQPDRDGFALAALGSVACLVDRGAGRFERMAQAVADRTARIVGEVPNGPFTGVGPVFTGAFAFDPQGCEAPHWSGFHPAELNLPEVSICRRGEQAFMTVNVDVAAGEDAHAPMARAKARLAALESAALTPSIGTLDHRATNVVQGPASPAEYEGAVAKALASIQAGELSKIVLAREVRLEAASGYDPAVLFGALRESFPGCFCFCVGSGESAFVGASPELLIRRSGAVAATVALAGSARRSADPAVDDHLGETLLRSTKNRSEHAIVVDSIKAELEGVSVWVEAESEPELARVANIQHLATPITAQLADSRSTIELCGRLHPTPATAGEPTEKAVPLIPELEAIDRGLYAGAIGWCDTVDDGEFCVGLRSALLRDRQAYLYAGAGIVSDSVPAEELAETEVKLEALLPLLNS